MPPYRRGGAESTICEAVETGGREVAGETTAGVKRPVREGSPTSG